MCKARARAFAAPECLTRILALTCLLQRPGTTTIGMVAECAAAVAQLRATNFRNDNNVQLQCKDDPDFPCGGDEMDSSQVCTAQPVPQGLLLLAL